MEHLTNYRQIWLVFSTFKSLQTPKNPSPGALSFPSLLPVPLPGSLSRWVLLSFTPAHAVGPVETPPSLVSPVWRIEMSSLKGNREGERPGLLPSGAGVGDGAVPLAECAPRRHFKTPGSRGLFGLSKCYQLLLMITMLITNARVLTMCQIFGLVNRLPHLILTWLPSGLNLYYSSFYFEETGSLEMITFPDQPPGNSNSRCLVLNMQALNHSVMSPSKWTQTFWQAL